MSLCYNVRKLKFKNNNVDNIESIARILSKYVPILEIETFEVHTTDILTIDQPIRMDDISHYIIECEIYDDYNIDNYISNQEDIQLLELQFGELLSSGSAIKKIEETV